MQNSHEIESHLERITEELVQIRKITVGLKTVDKLKAERVWKDLMEASKQISSEWKGPTALEEIRSQREKEW
jgi:ribosomal protein S10